MNEEAIISGDNQESNIYVCKEKAHEDNATVPKHRQRTNKLSISLTNDK